MCAISVTLCIFIVATIYTNKKLKGIHPSKLIAVMAVSLMCCTWHIGIWKMHSIYVICYTDANKYYKFLHGNITETEAIKELVHSNDEWFNLWQMIFLVLCICMCIDLFATFTNPLYPMERRLRIYFTLTIVIPLILIKYTNGILTSEPKYID